MEPEIMNKTNKEFYDLCYKQYEFEMKETDQLYQRTSLVLVLLSLLGTIVFKLGRTDIFNQMFVRVDIFLFYLSIAIAFVFLGASVFYAIVFILPRRGQYKTLATMDVWQKWRDEYNQYYECNKNDKEPDDALLHEITDKLAEAQANNAPINEKRRYYFHRCVLMAALAIIPIVIQAFFYLILELQGV